MSFVDLFAAMVLALVTLFASAVILRVVVFGVLFRRRGWHGAHGHVHGRGRRAWRLFRELRLTRSQRSEIRGLFREVRAAMRDLRGDLPGEVAGLLGRDTFDRPAAERVAETRLASLEQSKGLALDALARLHALLTAEQRAKVLAFASA